ncbi:unnamed protein product [Phytomonas sp. EM1]|nr:unnamed protein product [Phytomonas sp. EM1]|eukprot:CCW64259.1 unnamed protein product [Phytomonas sp. isolate EM1]
MDDTSDDGAYEPDEIDYFLTLEEAQAGSMGAGGVPSVRTTWTSIKGLCVAASSLALRYCASLPLKRISYLLCIRRELENDGRWPQSNEKGKPSAATSVFPAQEVVSHLYRSEGARGFFRGACLSATLAVLTNVENAVVMVLLRHLTKTVSTPFLYDASLPFSKGAELTQELDSEIFSKVFWWLVMPTLVWAARWPLRSLRTILMTTYMAGSVIVVEENTHGGHDEIDEETQAHGGDEENKSYSEVKPRQQFKYQDLTYTQLWRHVRAGCSWRDIIRNSWEVDLADHVTSIMLNKFTQACATLTLKAVKESPKLAPWLLLSPNATRDVLQISLSVAVAVVVTTVRQPLLVVSRRMALLSLPTPSSEGSHVHEDISKGQVDRPANGKNYQSRRTGLRYRSMWACVSYILHNEGWRSLFDGISFNLMVQMVLLGFVFVRRRFFMLR